MMNAKPTKFLIVGLGAIGRRHLDVLCGLEGGAQVTVLRRPTGSPADTPDGVRIVHDLDTALEGGIDAAIIASPAPRHVETAQRLAEAGVHVLVEKPLSDTLDGVDGLLETCRERGVVLQVGYCLRFLESQWAFHRALGSGRIGRVLSVEAEVGQYLPDWRPGRDYRQTVSARKALGGGALLELSHEIDYLLWHFGDLEEVKARMDQSGELEIDVEDTVEMMLTFKSGVLGRLHMDMISNPPHRRCQAEGDQGILVWDGMAMETRLFKAEGDAGEILSVADKAEKEDMYQRQFTHFLNCIETGTEPLVAGADGRNVLAVADAARRSAASGEAVRL